MRNHSEKVKDMAESVLPSTARVRARRERRMVHQRHRSRQRDLLVISRRAAFDGTAAQRGEEGDQARAETVFEADFEERRRIQDITYVVWDRRAADKVAPLVRWAGARVDRDARLRAAPPATQVEHFARLVPDNLIGRHALQHIEVELTYQAKREERRRRRRAGGKATLDARRNQVRRDVGVILSGGRHRELNDALRAGYRARATESKTGTESKNGSEALPCPARFLHGGHDITEFARAVAGHQWIVDVVRATAHGAA